MQNSFISSYINESKKILSKINQKEIEKIIKILLEIKKNKGRIFFIGVGGSAANTSHAVNDFRKILALEAYSPTDNVSETTANTNDEGWDSIFINYLKVSKVKKKDLVFVFSVGGGNLEKNVSPNIVRAIDYAKRKKIKIVGIIGNDGGYTKKNSNACVLIPVVNDKHITPHSEGMQAVIWHMIVSHPKLKVNKTKWESLK
tara:strand:- start:910 stop:1512 length:603 start_codon:yes stop_codon:yes gene_type:complete